MYNIYGTKIHLTRGDTLIANLEIKRDDETYIPAVGDVIRFAMKKDYKDEEPLILKTIDNNEMVLRLDSSDTKSLEFGEYVYDIQITMEDGTVDTFISDVFIVEPEVD